MDTTSEPTTGTITATTATAARFNSQINKRRLGLSKKRPQNVFKSPLKEPNECCTHTESANENKESESKPNEVEADADADANAEAKSKASASMGLLYCSSENNNNICQRRLGLSKRTLQKTFTSPLKKLEKFDDNTE